MGSMESWWNRGITHALSRAIESLILDDNKYVQIAQTGKDRIAQSFNLCTWVKEMETIYKNVLI